MKNLFLTILLGFSLSTTAQYFEVVGHVNTLVSGETMLAGDFVIRAVDHNQTFTLGAELGLRTLQVPNSNVFSNISVVPFGSLRNRIGKLSLHNNIGPVFSFAVGNVEGERQSLDLGVQYIQGVSYNNFILELYLRYGFREYSNPQPYEYTTLGAGLGYRF